MSLSPGWHSKSLHTPITPSPLMPWPAPHTLQGVDGRLSWSVLPGGQLSHGPTLPPGTCSPAEQGRHGVAAEKS